MSKFQPISRNQHAKQRWQRYHNFYFAAQDTVVTLVVQEFPRAQLALPIAFVQVDNAFTAVAMQGLKPGKNLFVSPDGRWLADYIPAAYRGYPFRLANTDTGQEVLCIDEDSGLITDGPDGEAFFDDDGSPTKAVADILNFLTRVQANRQVTTRICAVLQKHQLIQPWPIKVQGEQGEQNIQGLYRIDEAALNALSSEAFIELRQTGALPIAYCQLLSMQHLPKLGRLAQAHAQVEAADILKTAPSGELDLEFLNQDETIHFGNS